MTIEQHVRVPLEPPQVQPLQRRTAFWRLIVNFDWCRSSSSLPLLRRRTPPFSSAPPFAGTHWCGTGSCRLHFRFALRFNAVADIVVGLRALRVFRMTGCNGACGGPVFVALPRCWLFLLLSLQYLASSGLVTHPRRFRQTLQIFTRVNCKINQTICDVVGPV